MKRVSVVGLGKLGACMTATMASKGMQVIGVDVTPRNVELINKGLPPVVEPGLAELLEANRERIRATANYREAVFETDTTFIIVPTPSDENGGFSLRFVLEVCRDIGAALREKPGYHLVVVTSTVLPGAMESAILPILEWVSGKRCGVHFGLCYNPEFIALGSAIRDLVSPDFVLIGESDKKAGDLLESIYKAYLDNQSPIARMNFINAELAKISVNAFVTTKITFANTLAALCEKLPGADVDTVSAALGLDSRIGRRYLTGSLGYGGPCFPRDNQALIHVAREAGVSAPLSETTDISNGKLIQALAEKVSRHLKIGTTVSILGLAYKPGTNVVDESAGVILADMLAQRGHRIRVYDPIAMENSKRILKDKVEYAATLSESLKKSDVVVITIPCTEFKKLEPHDFLRGNPSVIVLDCWRILREKLAHVPGIHYVALGLGDAPCREIHPALRAFDFKVPA